MTVNFAAKGDPQGKGRPRFNRRTGSVYTPEKTANYEEYIGLKYNQQCGKTFPEDSQLRLEIDAYVKIPAGTSKKRRAKMLAGEIRPTSKPDGDNIQKIIADALNGVAYKDDKAIVSWRCDKWYGEVAKVIVKVSSDTYARWVVTNGIFECSICGYSFEHEGLVAFYNFCPCCGARISGVQEGTT